MPSRLNAGDLLVAPPNIIDPRFNKTVMLVTHSNSRGSFALCLNKRTDHTVNDILEPMDVRIELDCPLYWGGPISPNTVWMLHDNAWSIENSLPIDNNWAITSHTDMFEKIVNGCSPDRFRIFHGHAAWGPGQLEGELRGEEPWRQEHSWLIVNDPDPDWMMSDTEHLWTTGCSISGQQAVETWLT